MWSISSWKLELYIMLWFAVLCSGWNLLQFRHLKFYTRRRAFLKYHWFERLTKHRMFAYRVSLKCKNEAYKLLFSNLQNWHIISVFEIFYFHDKLRKSKINSRFGFWKSLIWTKKCFFLSCHVPLLRPESHIWILDLDWVEKVYFLQNIIFEKASI